MVRLMNASTTLRRGCRQAPRATAPRFAHFVDIENLVGGPIYCAAEVRRVWDQFERTCPELADSMVVMATSHPRSVLPAWCGSGGRARMVYTPGRDGADRALLAEMDVEFLARRATHVVIGSGDGAFASVASLLASRGLHVCVVSRAGSLSTRLALAVHEVRHLIADESERPVAVPATTAVPAPAPVAVAVPPDPYAVPAAVASVVLAPAHAAVPA